MVGQNSISVIFIAYVPHSTYCAAYSLIPYFIDVEKRSNKNKKRKKRDK